MTVGKGVGEEVGYASPDAIHREGVVATNFHNVNLSLQVLPESAWGVCSLCFGAPSNL